MLPYTGASSGTALLMLAFLALRYLSQRRLIYAIINTRAIVEIPTLASAGRLQSFTVPAVTQITIQEISSRGNIHFAEGDFPQILKWVDPGFVGIHDPFEAFDILDEQLWVTGLLVQEFTPGPREEGAAEDGGVPVHLRPARTGLSYPSSRLHSPPARWSKHERLGNQ